MTENELRDLHALVGHRLAGISKPAVAASSQTLDTDLNSEQVSRYSRQLLLPAFGKSAQVKLASASALVIGAGGLGSPVIMYLAGAGIGTLGVVDDDIVDTSNLHRQIVHGGCPNGTNKAVSAGRAVAQLNPNVNYVAYTERFCPGNADELVQKFDVVIDASDNLLTRYLVNDTCVFHNRPLVSGAAIGTEGYVTVYNYAPMDGLCYRCIYPEPPPLSTVGSCSENGVLGMVPGVIGCIQALEALKILSGIPTASVLARRLCIFDALAGDFSKIGLPPRSSQCRVCGEQPSICTTRESYEWCQRHGLTEPANCLLPSMSAELPKENRISCQQYNALAHSSVQPDGRHPWLLLDVRDRTQFSICALPNAINVPLLELNDRLEEIQTLACGREVVVVCRRGIDSISAVRKLVDHVGAKRLLCGPVRNLDGGLQEWHDSVDHMFPIY